MAENDDKSQVVENQNDAAGDSGSADDGAGDSGDAGDTGSEADTGSEVINPEDYTPEARETGAGDTGIADDDDETDPEDKARIDKRISRQLTPLQQTIQKQNDEIEVNSYIQDNPEFTKYKPAIIKYVAHPAYKNVAISNIAAIVSAKDAQKMGAAKERAAQAKAAEAKANSNAQSRTQSPGKFDATKATFAEMEAEVARVKGQA